MLTKSRILLTSAVLALAAGAAPAQAQAQAASAEQGQPNQAGQGQPSQTAPTQTGAAQAAGVDEAEQGGIETIVVTAQRRAQAVQDVPIAVSAFSSEQLETRNITEALDLIQYVPNMFGSNNTGIGSANVYYIRGIGNTESIATFDPPIGTYIDDVYISRQNANNFSLFDVERIEVLRGPQGTLFGRNTTGGAINIIMDKPGDELGGYAELSYGRFDKKLVRGSVDLPASDALAFKLSGFWQDSDGYVKNVTTGERLNDDDGSGVRLAARLEATPNISWNVSGAFIQDDSEALLNFECNPGDPTDCNGRFATTGLREHFEGTGSQFAPLPISGRKANFDLGNKTDTWLLTSNLGWELGDHTLNFITGYVDLEQTFALDFFDGRGGPSLADPRPVVRGFKRGGFTIINDGKHEQFTQEVKLTGRLFGDAVDYVTGVFYFDEDNRTDLADVFTLFSPAVPGNEIPLLLADRVLDNSTTAWAGYAQADFHATDQLTLTAGIRYTDEKKTFGISDNRATCAAGGPACLTNANMVALNGTPIPRRQNTEKWTPRFAVNFEPNDDILLFASATRGFKSGGWNARGTAASELLPFGPETVWSYEAGVKSEWLDRRLRVNLTGYWMDLSDLQVPTAFQRANGSIAFITRNFADYQNKGLELEVTAVPVEGLNAYVNVGWQDDKYKIGRNGSELDEFGVQSVAAQQAACRAQLAAGLVPLATGADNAPSCGNGIITPEGDIATPVRTPDWSVAAGFTYDIQLPAIGFTLTPAVNVVYRGDLETSTDNGSFFSGPITGPSGRVYPANPFGGEFITGSFTNDYVLVNAGLSLASEDKAWLLSVECNNCLSKTYRDTTLAKYNYLNRPMTWTVRVRRRF